MYVLLLFLKKNTKSYNHDHIQWIALVSAALHLSSHEIEIVINTTIDNIFFLGVLLLIILAIEK